MPNIEQNLAVIRRRLGQPLSDAPDDGTLLSLLVDQFAHHTTQLSVTRNHWAVNNWTLNTQAGLEEYPITAQNFGRPILLYTVDNIDPYHIRREIPFSLLQDVDRRYIGPVTASPIGTNLHTASVVSFYRKEGQGWFLQLTPIPGNNAQYELWYETNYLYGSLSDTPGVEIFQHLVRVQTALAALPLCAWPGIAVDIDMNIWSAKLGILRDALLHDEMLYTRTFNSYRAQATRDGVTTKLGYSPESDSWPLSIGSMASGYGV